MRIGVLSKGGADWIGGLYYTLNLIRALRALPQEEQPEIRLLVSHEDDVDQFKDLAKLAKLCRVPVHESPPSSPPTINPGLGRLLEDEGIDLIFPCMRSLGRKFPFHWLPWVPDLQHRCHPEFFSEDDRERRDREFGRIAADSTLVVLSSRTALSDFDRAYPGHHEKLRVLHFSTVASPSWYEGDAPATVRRFELPGRYLMVSNQFWVHKNHRVAFEAVKILVDRGVDVHLVCTGKPEDPRRPQHGRDLRNFVHMHHLAGRIHVLGLTARLDQIQLMRAAAAILQPSLFEGWSTVVEDARALGKRLFLSDIAVHREQNPEGAVYFDPHRPEALADAIAGTWEALPVSPCFTEEQKALAAQRDRVVRYARNFFDIARELLLGNN